MDTNPYHAFLGIISGENRTPDDLTLCFGNMRNNLKDWKEPEGRSSATSTLTYVQPFLLARLCEVAGLSLPGQQVVSSPLVGGGQQLPRANLGALFHGLHLLYEIEKTVEDTAAPALLTTPGSLGALRALALSLHRMNGGDFSLDFLHTERVSKPLDILLLLLERLALNPNHGAPRAVLHASLLPVVLAVALGEGTTRSESTGGRRSLESALSLFNGLAGVHFEHRVGSKSGSSASSVLRRGDAAHLVDCLVEPQPDLPAVAPLLPRLGALYRWGTPGSGAGGGGAPELARPPAFQWSPTVSRVAERHPALMRDLVAGPGLSILVSHLGALAVGHWRQWGDRYAGGGGEQQGEQEGGEQGGASDPVPTNWPFEALRTLIVRGGLLSLYAAALTLHMQATEGGVGASYEYALEEGSLASLLLATARVFRALRLDHGFAVERERVAAARAAASSSSAPTSQPTLLVAVLPQCLASTGLGRTLASLLQLEMAQGAAGSETTISALLACLSALDECEAVLC